MRKGKREKDPVEFGTFSFSFYLLSFFIVKFRCAPLLLALAFALPARAQDTSVADGPVKMNPEFCFTFPVVQMNKHDVSVKYPVMINPVTVLKPGMVLRVIYVPPVQGDTMDLMGAHKGTMEESYSRETANTDAHQASLPPEMAHEIEKQRRRVWEVTGNFVLAIAQLPTDVMHLIYSPSGMDRTVDLVDTSFSFFNGMFVGSPNNGVQVLAVEKGSYAEQAGIKPGDEITAVGNIPIGSDLNAFANAFAMVKKAGKTEEKTSFPVTVRSGGTIHTVAMPLTPSIKNFLNEGL
jgi:hypothetical protein